MALFRRRAEGWQESLDRVQRSLAAARAEAVVLTEQLAALDEDADSQSVRAVVSENTADVRDARHARGHAERFARQLARVRARIEALTSEEQEILNRPLFDD